MTSQALGPTTLLTAGRGTPFMVVADAWCRASLVQLKLLLSLPPFLSTMSPPIE